MYYSLFMNRWINHWVKGVGFLMLFSHSFLLGLPSCQKGYQKNTAWFHKVKVDMLRLIDNTVPHDPSLKVTQIFWLFSYCSKRLSHSTCPDSPSGPESMKAFQETAGDEKNNASQNKLCCLNIPSLECFQIKNHRIRIYSWLNLSSLEKSIFDYYACRNSWLRYFTKIFPLLVLTTQVFLSEVG